MAYGRTCPVCGAIVDNNEFNFSRYMCYECEAKQEQEDIRCLEVVRLANSRYEQMKLEV